MIGHLTGKRLHRLGALVAAGVIATSLAACSSDDGDDNGGGGGGGSSTEVKLGYFPNLTHASAIVGIEKGYFKDELAKDNATVKTLDFNSGSDTIDALNNGDLDATYIGPSPAITAFATSHNVSVISGATSGGASLVVNKDIKSAKDLAGKTLATPGAGNTQDVALKYWLKEQGYDVNPDGQGDVTVINQDNSLTVQAFGQGQVDGAWLPEPYASLLIDEGATKLVDEKDLWPGGEFVTTHLIVNNDFLKDHPDLVDDLLQGQIESNDYIAENPDDAKTLVGGYIGKLTGSQVPANVLDSAWSQLTFTNDPIADSLLTSADHAAEVGLIDPVDDLADIYDLDPLNKLLAGAGESQVSGPSQ
ncbi:MAG TPA: ABC transporter substrate-binding protein [Nocardioidaceae bacterium]